jgi:nucleotide sugar dehydrogenase
MSDIVLIGESSKDAGDIIEQLYRKFIKNNPVYCRVTPLEAEITKIALNCFLTTKIAFANCIGDLSKKVGANPHNILSTIGSDSRIGNKYLRWGHGFGGPCFPRDNRALNFFARQHNIINNIGEATDLSNKEHFYNLINLIKNNISKDTNILFTYLSYKPESNILEESQQLQLALTLQDYGYIIYIKEKPIIKEYISKFYPNAKFNYLSNNQIINNYIDINIFLS